MTRNFDVKKQDGGVMKECIMLEWSAKEDGRGEHDTHRNEDASQRAPGCQKDCVPAREASVVCGSWLTPMVAILGIDTYVCDYSMDIRRLHIVMRKKEYRKG